MPTITELIEDYQEGDFLDFKREEYKREKKHELIKDVLAFANSEHIGDRYIIIGIKKSGDDVEGFNIDSPEDSANIQSIIHDNIKPDLNIEYVPFIHGDKKLVILTIKNPTDKPYSTKKIVANPSGGVALAENSFKIRKGSRIKDISRDDLDKIYSIKYDQNPNFDGKVKITFKENEQTRIQLNSIGNPELPSTIQWKKIQSGIMHLENLIANESENILMNKNLILLQNKERSAQIERLKEEQSKVKTSFKYDDLYFLNEKISHKLQFNAKNDGDITLKDCSLIIQIDHYDGLNISNRVFTEQANATSKPVDIQYYPRPRIDNNGCTTMSTSVGDIKHKLKQELLHSKIRVYFDNILIGQTIRLKLSLHADNWPDLFEFELFIDII